MHSISPLGASTPPIRYVRRHGSRGLRPLAVVVLSLGIVCLATAQPSPPLLTLEAALEAAQKAEAETPRQSPIEIPQQ